VKKGTTIALLLILVAAIGLYLMNNNKEGALVAPVTSSTTLAELWNLSRKPKPNIPGKTKPLVSTSTRTRRGGSSAPQQSGTTPENSGFQSVYAYASLYRGITPAIARVDESAPYLVYVSKTSALPAGYNAGVKRQVCVPNLPSGDREMEATAATQYRLMYDAAKKEHVSLIPFSGYRSTLRQKANFDNKIANYQNQGKTRAEAIAAASTSIMPPGCSEHEAGLAMDIAAPGNGKFTTDPGFEHSAEYKWLRAHAHEYGFILRYPKDKTALTQITYEPWHWRYVGKGPATQMRQSGQCLEEYLGVVAIMNQ
jgi:D-alanyl-D-alanine carboxypeptidase